MLRLASMGIVTVGLLVGPVACTPEAYLPDPVIHTPLAFDPTEQYQLSAWWTNGQQLLRLANDHSYQLYESQNRYDEPAQRGRWSTINYAALRLEPYRVRGGAPTRVAITKSGDELTLLIPKLAPMNPIPAPPRTIEDALLGEWRSEQGVLSIREGRRYSFSPAKMTAADPAFIAGHRGAWRIEDEQLVLIPDAPAMDPTEFRVEFDTAEDTEAGGDGEVAVPTTGHQPVRLVGPDAAYRPVERGHSPNIL